MKKIQNETVEWAILRGLAHHIKTKTKYRYRLKNEFYRITTIKQKLVWILRVWERFDPEVIMCRVCGDRICVDDSNTRERYFELSDPQVYEKITEYIMKFFSLPETY